MLELLAARRVLLLVSGAVAVALAQIGLYLSLEINTRAPLGYLLLLALGVGLFALGSLGLWRSRSGETRGTPDHAHKSAAWPLASLRSGYGKAGLAAGGALMAVLLGLLATGWESGSTLLLWAAALVAFAVVFWPPNAVASHLRNFAFTRWLRHYCWDVVAVSVLAGIFLAVCLYDLQHWYYSAIGDEFLFYEHARRILDEGIARPFSQEGVYNKHPVMTSILQATVMRVFGGDYFGWTFSETLNAALTIPAVYLLGRILGGRSSAVAAAGLFAFSHFILAFSHTRYANLSPLPVTAWALVFFLTGLRNGNPLLLFAAGVLAGLGFYTHYSGRAIILIIALFSITQGSPRRLLQLWPLAFGFALTTAPTFAVDQVGVFTRMFGQVVGGYSEVVTGSVGQRLLSNLELNLQAFNYSPTVHTYVYGPLMDPVSGALSALGIGFALGHIRHSAYRFLLLWFVVGMLMTGVLSPYPHVAITRLLFVVPPLALMAGLLIKEFSSSIPVLWSKFTGLRGTVLVPGALSLLLPAILLLNLWQFWQVTPNAMPHSPEAVALGAFRSEECGTVANETVFVGHATGEGSLMHQVLTAFYPNGPMPRRLDHRQLAEGHEVSGSPPRCVIFVNPGDPRAIKLQEELGRRYPDGRIKSFTNPSGTTAVDVFLRP